MSRFTDETLKEVKARVRLSDLVGRTVRLKRKGKDYVGLSPFSNEKTPSFYVHDDRGFYKCFSTQKSGDCITWVMEQQGLTFGQAVEQLAADVGVELVAATPQQTEAANQRARILQCLEWAHQYFARALFWGDSDDARAARAYVQGRALYVTNADLTASGVGWAPSAGRQLMDAAHASGWGVGDLEAAGLIRRDDKKQPRPLFRDRITLPVRDLQGRVIAFTARALKEGQQPKYLNSPETPVFTKGAAMFNLHQARTVVSKGAELHIVEGCFDAERMRILEYAAAAPLGTALTPQQLELAWRVTESPILTFDGDDAGLRAARLAAAKALPLMRGARGLRFIVLPQGEDPDSLLRAGGKLPAPVSHFAVIWGGITHGLDMTDPGDRTRARAKASELLGTIADKATKAEWRTAFSLKLKDTPVAPRAAPAGWPPARATVTREARAAKPALVEPEATAAALLAILLDEPVRVDAHLETLAGLPCGRFTPLRDYLVGGAGEQEGLLEPWAVELQAELRRLGTAPTRYSADGWERAARALAAKYPTKQ